MGVVKLGDLLTWTQPHNLGFGRLKCKPTGSQPDVDICQTPGETVDCRIGIIDCRLVHLSSGYMLTNDLAQPWTSFKLSNLF